MKKWIAPLLCLAFFMVLFGCPTPLDEPKDVVTGVTITGDGVQGTGENKEITIVIGTPVDLDITITKSGNPDVTTEWSTADDTTVSVDPATGLLNGIKESAEGVLVTVTVGTKSDNILVKVAMPTEGITLGFDTDTLEFQTIATTNPFTAGSPVPPTVVKNGNVITLMNIDGTFREADSIQGTSYLLFGTPFAESENFEVKAAVRIIRATGSSDKYAAGVGMFTTDTEGNLTPDSHVALVVKRARSSGHDIRSLYSKSNNANGDFSAGSPNIAGVNLSEYHILSTKRVGNVVTFDANGVTHNVTIEASQTGMWPELAGEVKAGLMFAGVTVEVEGFIVNELDETGEFVSELYRSSDMPEVAFEVNSISLTGPEGMEDAATIDMAEKTTETLQLSTAYIPETATIGATVTYSVSEGDGNVTVDQNGLVTITGTGDGSATITATSGNGKTDTYTITIVDSSADVTGITIPSTLDIAAGQTLVLSPVTVEPPYASDKSVIWESSNTAVIVVDEVTGEITVAAGAEVGQTAVVTARSVKTPSAVSNGCTVTVIEPPTGVITYTFPTANWGENAAALLVSTATVDTTVNFLDLDAAVLHTDGLSYKTSSAGHLRLRYSAANGNSVNYNGASISGSLPADGESVGDEPSLSRYISVPLNAVATPTVTISVAIKTTASASGSASAKVGLVGSDFVLLKSRTVDTTAATDYALSWTGPIGTLDRVIIVFSREGSGGGGIDVRSITVTPVE